MSNRTARSPGIKAWPWDCAHWCCCSRNPFAVGRTRLEVTPFHREQDLELEIGGERELSSTGVTARLDYDNTDWFNNPTSGSRTQFAVTRDWSGNEPGNAPWTQVEAQYSKYWPLGPNQRAQQRVIAFDAWISDVPTWDDYDLVDGEPLFHRPPVLLGSTLGGLFRQRGFATNRFNDRSAINYMLEYRYGAGHGYARVHGGGCATGSRLAPGWRHRKGTCA